MTKKRNTVFGNGEADKFINSNSHMKRYKIIFSFVAVFFMTAMTSFKHNIKFADDYIEFWTNVKNNYAYFSKKHTDWNKEKTVYLPQAENTKIKMS